MTDTPRCGAKTRNGGTCKKPPLPGTNRCRVPTPKPGHTCENGTSPNGAGNTARALTHSSDSTREGLAMQATRKRGIEPAPVPVVTGLTEADVELTKAWPLRFREKVRISEGCWEWLGAITAGHGRYALDAKSGWQVAHRFAWEQAHGPLDASLVLDHLCRNRACVRPAHLEPVTQAQNVRRGLSSNDPSGLCRSGRHAWTAENILVEPNGARRCRPCRDEREHAYRPTTGNANGDKTHCPQGHEYTPENTRVRANGSRDCKACHRERERARYHTRKAKA